MDAKSEVLFILEKLDRFRLLGVPTRRHFTTQDTLEDLRFELARIEYQFNRLHQLQLENQWREVQKLHQQQLLHLHQEQQQQQGKKEPPKRVD